jgi:hypothetical protein
VCVCTSDNSCYDKDRVSSGLVVLACSSEVWQQSAACTAVACRCLYVLAMSVDQMVHNILKQVTKITIFFKLLADMN